jgi:glycine oxidase
MPNSAQRRVAIIGAGVTGCASAYQLSRAGFAVTLLERDAVAAHASGRNAGNLNPLHGTPAQLVPFALEVFHLHAKIREELTDLGCARCAAVQARRIYLGYEESDRLHLQQTAATFAATSGFRGSWLPRADLLRIEPRLAEGTVLGVLAEGNLTIDGFEFARSLADGASRLGCSILCEEVLGITTCGERVTGVNTRHRIVPCDELVLATGPWVAAAKSWLGIDVPVEPLKGEILQVQLSPPLPTCDLTWNTTSIYRRGKDVWIGTTMTNCGLDETPTQEARDELLTRAARMIPEVAGAPVLDHLAAIRPMSGNGAPIAVQAPGWQNVYIANGGGSKGVLWSVGIGKAIVNLLTAGYDALSAEGSA